MPENNEPQKTKYEILYCEENCSAEDIKKSYQKLILKYHPDKQFSQQEQSIKQLLPPNTIDNEKFIKITEAWNILRDPEKRKCYDAELLQSRFNIKPIVYEILTNADFQYDNDLQLKIYKCRCGGFYAMPSEDDLNLNNSSNNNNNDAENINYVECTECSLVIQFIQ